jgi:2-polyprenyl-6-hydroxyphenyl methylase/3-demethylubiquinone-9 3-methyltransferase
MSDYYSEKLSAERLMRVYELAPPEVQRYLAAEIEFVRQRIHSTGRVLELGCGYGRVLKELAPCAAAAVGIDTSFASLQMARGFLNGCCNCSLLQMNAVEPGFKPRQFDIVVCIQNGISAFHVDQTDLISQAVAVTRPGGRVLLSSYSERFWQCRLEWFRIQAAHGLLGEIDENATANGVIVCKDGFRATTVGPAEFKALTTTLNLSADITEVAESAIFCEIFA